VQEQPLGAVEGVGGVARRVGGVEVERVGVEPPGTCESTPIAVSLSRNTSFSSAPLDRHSIGSASLHAAAAGMLRNPLPAPRWRHAPCGFTWWSCTSKMNSSPASASVAAASSNGASRATRSGRRAARGGEGAVERRSVAAAPSSETR
jgi:hypothetical protein